MSKALIVGLLGLMIPAASAVAEPKADPEKDRSELAEFVGKESRELSASNQVGKLDQFKDDADKRLEALAQEAPAASGEIDALRKRLKDLENRARGKPGTDKVDKCMNEGADCVVRDLQAQFASRTSREVRELQTEIAALKLDGEEKPSAASGAAPAAPPAAVPARQVSEDAEKLRQWELQKLKMAAVAKDEDSLVSSGGFNELDAAADHDAVAAIPSRAPVATVAAQPRTIEQTRGDLTLLLRASGDRRFYQGNVSTENQREAVLKFQSHDKKLPQTGELDDETRMAIQAEIDRRRAASKGAPLLGEEGPLVEDLQKTLKKTNPKLKVDKKYGPKTQAALCAMTGAAHGVALEKCLREGQLAMPSTAEPPVQASGRTPVTRSTSESRPHDLAEGPPPPFSAQKEALTPEDALLTAYRKKQEAAQQQGDAPKPSDETATGRPVEPEQAVAPKEPPSIQLKTLSQRLADGIQRFLGFDPRTPEGPALVAPEPKLAQEKPQAEPASPPPAPASQLKSEPIPTPALTQEALIERGKQMAQQHDDAPKPSLPGSDKPAPGSDEFVPAAAKKDESMLSKLTSVANSWTNSIRNYFGSDTKPAKETASVAAEPAPVKGEQATESVSPRPAEALQPESMPIKPAPAEIERTLMKAAPKPLPPPASPGPAVSVERVPAVAPKVESESSRPETRVDRVIRRILNLPDSRIPQVSREGLAAKIREKPEILDKATHVGVVVADHLDKQRPMLAVIALKPLASEADLPPDIAWHPTTVGRGGGHGHVYAPARTDPDFAKVSKYSTVTDSRLSQDGTYELASKPETKFGNVALRLTDPKVARRGLLFHTAFGDGLTKFSEGCYRILPKDLRDVVTKLRNGIVDVYQGFDRPEPTGMAKK